MTRRVLIKLEMSVAIRAEKLKPTVRDEKAAGPRDENNGQDETTTGENNKNVIKFVSDNESNV